MMTLVSTAYSAIVGYCHTADLHTPTLEGLLSNAEQTYSFEGSMSESCQEPTFRSLQ
jgi:hypothetical protein